MRRGSRALPKAPGSIETPIEEKREPAHISTSHVERGDLTLRMAMRRFTRLKSAFSKKIDSHVCVLSIYVAFYN
ncbi:MAG: hypothetical protein ABR878_15410 [Roseiarcus sp.]